MLYLANRLKRERRARLGGSCEEGAAEEGFTLIELMVVLLIMGILMAIAIPTFLSVTGSAGDKAAQSDLTNAVTNATSYYVNGQNFTNYSPKSTAITYTAVSTGSSASVPSATNVVGYTIGSTDNSVEFESYSSAGVCWYILLDKNTSAAGSSFYSGAQAGTYYYGVKATSGASYCTPVTGGWQKSFAAAAHAAHPALP
ncbi:MAG: prepilin-type N-terminal cleavage/methylation domain-containing protein [Actinobacteria bacterium]|nr:prepilin-type N-terminal cleavage/methylation domain-containing protein [Actinomycetota bacterium]